MEESAHARSLPHAAKRWGHAAAEARRLAEVLEGAIANLRPRPESDPEIEAETVAG